MSEDRNLRDLISFLGAHLSTEGRIVFSRKGQEYWLDVSADQLEEQWPSLVDDAAKVWPDDDPSQAALQLLGVLIDEAVDLASDGDVRLVLRPEGFHALE